MSDDNQNQGNTINVEAGSSRSHESDNSILQNVKSSNGEDCVEKREEKGSSEYNIVQEGSEDRSKVSNVNADCQEVKHCAEENQQASQESKLKNKCDEDSKNRSDASAVNACFLVGDKSILQNIKSSNGVDCVEKREEIGSSEYNIVQEGNEDRSKVSNVNADCQEVKHCPEEEAQQSSQESKLDNKGEDVSKASAVNADLQEVKHCPEEETQQSSQESKLDNKGEDVSKASAINADCQEVKHCPEEEAQQSSQESKLDNKGEDVSKASAVNADFQEVKHCPEEEAQQSSQESKLDNKGEDVSKASAVNADCQEVKHSAEEETQQSSQESKLDNKGEDVSKASAVNGDFQEVKHSAEEEAQQSSQESKLDNKGEDVSKASAVNADFQEVKHSADEETQQSSQESKLENKGEDVSKALAVNADFQEVKHCAEEEAQRSSQESKLENKVEEDSEDRSKVFDLKSDIKRDNVIVDAAINPEMANEDNNNKPSCSDMNIADGKPDIHNINDGSQRNNSDLDNSVKQQLVNDKCDKIKSINTLYDNIIKQDLEDEEEDKVRCLEINTLKTNVMNEDEFKNILTIRNKIIEMFPDVEETYLLNLCYNKLGVDTVAEVSEILLKGEYPKDRQLHNYNVAKWRDDEILKYLSNDIKTEEDFRNFKTENKDNCTDTGFLFNCPCCYEEYYKIDAMVDCSKGCYACKVCVVRNMEITYGEGSVSMSCLLDCGGKYTMDQLEGFMKQTMFAGIGRLLQQREIEGANINDLHRCPFCDYAAIVEEFIFNCTECGKDSCILCQKEPHPSFLCDEVEDDNDVHKRTFVENQMSEALFRTCPKCKIKMIKEDGCNKMTCPCGTLMCYICKAIVLDYSHFNAQGGTNYNLCPLHNDTEEMHAANVRDRAEEAMKEVGGNLKIDPTV